MLFATCSRRPLHALLAISALTLAHCASKGELEATQTDVAKLEQRIAKLEAARPAAPNVPPAPRGPDASATYAVPVGTSAVLGPKDAWVTIVEISDFQCPFCSRGAATIKEVVAKYKGDVRVAFKHNPLPFHPRAMPAAIAAECAGRQHKFWPMADSLFAEQGKLGDEDIKGFAKALGLDEAAFARCQADAAVQKSIAADQELAAKFGARGTPAFFINGRFLSGAQPLPAFVALIDEELAKAKASGSKKGDYYVRAIEGQGVKSL